MKFLNRTDELGRLRARWLQKTASLVVLYGRRRCGKSTLLQRVAQPGDVYYLASQESAALQREALAREIGRVFPGFEEASYATWNALFRSLQKRAPAGCRLMLDEFPYLVQSSPELPSVLQQLWDRPETRTISLTLCGSSQRMMQGLVLSRNAPLFGRADEIMRIEPLAAGWIAEALRLGPREAVEGYAIWGGVPRYWEMAEDFQHTWEAVQRLLLDRHGVLFNEPARLLQDEMRSAVQAISLLTLIGYGCHRLSEIAARLGHPAGSLVRPLNHLIELGYVQREYPFGASAKSSKRTLYKLADPFLRFYFRFVEPQRSRLEFGLHEQVLEELLAGFSGYCAGIWEELARQAVPRLTAHGQRWKPAARWWGAGLDGKPLELDVVAESVDGRSVLVGEVKWGQHAKNSRGLHGQLLEKARRCPALQGRKIFTTCWLGGGGTTDGEEQSIVFGEEETLEALRW
jgi:AAA+ ATPase superfamily predicted ATPase